MYTFNFEKTKRRGTENLVDRLAKLIFSPFKVYFSRCTHTEINSPISLSRLIHNSTNTLSSFVFKN